MTVRLRPFHSRDIAEAVTLHQQCLNWPWSERSLKETLATQGCIGLSAIVDKSLVGFVLGRCLKEQAEILTLVVGKAWQRKGIGKQLLNGLLQEVVLQGATKVFLEVQESNSSALAVYDSLGFEQIGERGDYYPFQTGHSRKAVVLQKATS